MQRSKSLLRIFAKIILGFLIFLIVYACFAFFIPMIAVNSTDDDPAQDIAIYIKTNGVHTDIVMPIFNDIYDWRKLADPVKTAFADPSVQYVAIGWGDKGFYLNTPEWSDLEFSTAFNAAFYLGSAAMHTTFYREIDKDGNCIKIMVSKKEYERLTEFIESSFVKDRNGNSQFIVGSYGNHDNFYEAVGGYNLFYTCNSWANNALKAGGQKAALWSLTDSGIFRHYQ